MSHPTDPHSTNISPIEASPRPDYCAVGKAMLHLEDEVCELKNMAGMLTSVLEQYFGGELMRIRRENAGKSAKAMREAKEEIEQHLFGLYEVNGRCRKMYEAFYDASDATAEADQIENNQSAVRL